MTNALYTFDTYELNDPEDDNTCPPVRAKMAEWELQVTRGQWSRLPTDCPRCHGRGGAKHKNDDGCWEAQRIRRFKLKKYYMGLERDKMKEFRVAHRTATMEQRRLQALQLNMDKKRAMSNMSRKQREIARLAAQVSAQRPHAV